MTYKTISTPVYRILSNRFFICVFCLLPFFGLLGKSPAQAKGPYALVDLQSGQILAGERINDRWYPASLTKLMTAYTTFRAIADGEIAAGSPVVISNKAAKQPPSRMGYKAGVRLRVDTALKIIIVKSANDVSHALAESVSGSVKNFVTDMNSHASRLGLVNTNFDNPHGLHSKRQYTSARDIAVLARAIIREFPQYAKWFKTPAIKTSTKVHYSYNMLLERFSGTTGMKTGFVCASGYNMVASAERGGRELAAIVLGRSSQTDRADAAARLLTQGFQGKHSGVQNLDSPARSGKNAINMRGVLCTEKARKARYDPAAANAVIKSSFLSKRIRKPAIPISIGGIDAPASAAYLSRRLTPRGKVAVPVRRPNYLIRDVDGVQLVSSISTSVTGIPTKRPN